MLLRRAAEASGPRYVGPMSVDEDPHALLVDVHLERAGALDLLQLELEPKRLVVRHHEFFLHRLITIGLERQRVVPGLDLQQQLGLTADARARLIEIDIRARRRAGAGQILEPLADRSLQSADALLDVGLVRGFRDELETLAVRFDRVVVSRNLL